MYIGEEGCAPAVQRSRRTKGAVPRDFHRCRVLTHRCVSSLTVVAADNRFNDCEFFASVLT